MDARAKPGRVSPPTFDEWAAELERLGAERLGVANPPGVFTVPELAEKLGVSSGTALRRVRAMHKAGRVTATRKMVQDMAGRLLPVPAYKLLRTGGRA